MIEQQMMKIQDDNFYTGMYSDEACLALDYALEKMPSLVFENHSLHCWTRRAPDGEVYLKIDSLRIRMLSWYPYPKVCKSFNAGIYDSEACEKCSSHGECWCELAIEEIRDIASRCLALMRLRDIIFHIRLFWDLSRISESYPNDISKSLAGKPVQDPFRFMSMETLAEEWRNLQNDGKEDTSVFFKNAKRLREIKEQFNALKYGKERWTLA